MISILLVMATTAYGDKALDGRYPDRRYADTIFRIQTAVHNPLMNASLVDSCIIRLAKPSETFVRADIFVRDRTLFVSATLVQQSLHLA